MTDASHVRRLALTALAVAAAQRWAAAAAAAATVAEQRHVLRLALARVIPVSKLDGRAALCASPSPYAYTGCGVPQPTQTSGQPSSPGNHTVSQLQTHPAVGRE